MVWINKYKYKYGYIWLTYDPFLIYIYQIYQWNNEWLSTKLQNKSRLSLSFTIYIALQFISLIVCLHVVSSLHHTFQGTKWANSNKTSNNRCTLTHRATTTTTAAWKNGCACAHNAESDQSEMRNTRKLPSKFCLSRHTSCPRYRESFPVAGKRMFVSEALIPVGIPRQEKGRVSKTKLRVLPRHVTCVGVWVNRAF